MSPQCYGEDDSEGVHRLTCNFHAGTDQQERERKQVIALDTTLKKESIRASKISEELIKYSMKRDSPVLRTHVCSYLALCERFKDNLIIKHALIALGPEHAVCFCETCAASKPLVQVAGSPPQQYTLPIGWCQFIHRWLHIYSAMMK